MKSLFTIIFFSLGIIFSYANGCGVKDSVGVKLVKELKCMKYVVEKGETLYGISTKYNVSVQKLTTLNPQLKNGLKIGQTIFIPFKDQSIEFDNEKYKHSQGNKLHLVEQGETYYSIARKYNIAVNDLLAWNKKKDLKAGQKIFVAPVQQIAEVVYQPIKTEKKVEKNTMPTDKDGKIVFQTVVQAEKKTEEVSTEKPRYNDKGEFSYDKSTEQVLLIPFYPNLYFSDADQDIAKHSHLPQGKSRDIFRKEILQSVEPKGYDNIYLLGGNVKDSVSDLSKIYQSVQYKHQEILENKDAPNKKEHRSGGWFSKKVEKEEEVFSEKYFAVHIIDSTVFEFFEKKYNIDYFIFINQFEIQTEEAKGDIPFSRTLIAHFSIYKSDGTKVAGNKCQIKYLEDTNNIHRILRDNLPILGKEIANEMPAPTY